jgi:MFS family permease
VICLDSDWKVVRMKEARYGWVMVALGAFMTCIAIGAMFSLAVFLQPITQATGWSHTAVSSAMTLNFLAMGAAGFGWGALSDRIGPRSVVLAGAVLLGLGLFLASHAQSALQFQLAFGLLVPFAFPPVLTKSVPLKLKEVAT